MINFDTPRQYVVPSFKNIVVVNVVVQSFTGDDADVVKFRILADDGDNWKKEYVDNHGCPTEHCIDIVNEITNCAIDEHRLRNLAEVELEYLSDIPEVY